MKSELKYRTFDELLSSVALDLPIQNNEGMIEPAQLIKIAQMVNYNLGLKIHRTKETIIDVCNYKAKLPDDFNVLNFAMLCYNYRIIEPVPSGTTHIDTIIEPELGSSGNCADNTDVCGNSTDPTFQNKIYTVCDNTCVKVIECVQYQTREYSDFINLTIRPGKWVSPTCFNLRVQEPNSAEIKDGFIYTSVENAKIFISYEGAMEDDEGNLLVLDHPQINEYYETAVTERIFRNLYYAGEDMAQKLQLAKSETAQARRKAMNIVNMPTFREMYESWLLNRKIQYSKYYSPFMSHYGR